MIKFIRYQLKTRQMKKGLILFFIIFTSNVYCQKQNFTSKEDSIFSTMDTVCVEDIKFVDCDFIDIETSLPFILTDAIKCLGNPDKITDGIYYSLDAESKRISYGNTLFSFYRKSRSADIYECYEFQLNDTTIQLSYPPLNIGDSDKKINDVFPISYKNSEKGNNDYRVNILLMSKNSPTIFMNYHFVIMISNNKISQIKLKCI